MEKKQLVKTPNKQKWADERTPIYSIGVKRGDRPKERVNTLKTKKQPEGEN